MAQINLTFIKGDLEIRLPHIDSFGYLWMNREMNEYCYFKVILSLLKHITKNHNITITIIDRIINSIKKITSWGFLSLAEYITYIRPFRFPCPYLSSSPQGLCWNATHKQVSNEKDVTEFQTGFVCSHGFSHASSKYVLSVVLSKSDGYIQHG